MIEAKLKNQDTLIIIHVEPQSTYQKDFHQRMYNYFSLLYNKYRRSILPIAIFSYDDHHVEQKKIAIRMLKEELPIELIAKVTHIDKEAIEELRKCS